MDVNFFTLLNFYPAALICLGRICMIGIAEKHLKPIHALAKRLEPNYNTEKLGTWGILFFCCGALAAGNDLWRDIVKKSDTYIPSKDFVKLMRGSEICNSDEYAVRFSECIKEWCNSSYAKDEAEKRMEQYRYKISERVYLCNKEWVVLGYMLNSSQDMSKEELLGFDCQTWINMSGTMTQNYGWPELFFAAGLLLSSESSVSWDKMASAILGMYKPHKEEVTALYEHYAGRNPIAKSGSRSLRSAEELKRGTRVRLRNGWEAIINQKCKGNILNATVFGDFTETGSIYTHDIIAAEINGQWVDVEMTEGQAQFHKEVKPFFNGGAG
jgi:hypothetical protein